MKKIQNKWILLFVICLGGGIIYIFPYLQYTFYDSMMEALKFNNTQMGNIMSVYGALNLVAYFIGGVVADKFPPKYLLTFSLAATGIVGFWFAAFPSYTSMLIISVIWSITTVFSYWPAVIKAVKLLGNSNEQGRLFGFREALNSMISMILSSLALFIFSHSGENFRNVVIFYSIAYIIVALVTFLLLPNQEPEEADEKRPGIFEGIGYVLKSPTVWIIGFVIFFAYGIGSTMGRLAPYLTAVFKMGATTAGIVAILNTYAVGNVGAVVGGIVTDKIKSSIKFILWSFVIMAVLLVAFVLTPGLPSLLMVAVVLGLCIRLVQTAVRGVYFVPLDEAKIPNKYVGTAAGVVSVIGFAPDAFLFTIWGKIMDANPGEAGYKMMFGALIGFCAVGFVLTLVLKKMLAKKAVNE
ncbi:MAG: MFS transporter [Hespellia sp.]|nr:MFS transporter [Hespellia sp.]